MSSYTWPTGRDWAPKRFRMQVMPNERCFPGYYSGQSQAVDLLGEYWVCQLTLPARCSEALGALREVFFEQLRGRVNTLQLWNQKRPAPRGTMRGTPTVRTSAAQLASTINVQTVAGKTLEPGDLIGFGAQVSRVMGMATLVADGSGHIDNVPVWPRVRAAVSGGAAITWDKPLITFRMADGAGVPIDWTAGDVSDEIAFALIEA